MGSPLTPCLRLPAPPQTHHHPLGRKSGFCQLQMNRMKASEQKVWQIQINGQPHRSSCANSAHTKNHRWDFSNRGRQTNKKITHNHCQRVRNTCCKYLLWALFVWLFKNVRLFKIIEGVELRRECLSPPSPNKQTNKQTVHSELCLHLAGVSSGLNQLLLPASS